MIPRHVGYVLGRQLKPIGEVFDIEHRWVAIDIVLSMKFDQKQIIERMKAKLEKVLFDGWGKLPENIKILLEEFASGRNLPSSLTSEEAFSFAQRRALKEEVV